LKKDILIDLEKKWTQFEKNW